ncbi:MAG: patatin-like phospholipase family protein [Alphaproteobacteria bacterium]|nr:patatin-like phospholipase family protein [Alphaproteobacteria bacterium]
MKKLGLSLSGGGFRATLYHLGVVRFLRDAGMLGQVTDIASVSGGSILSAHLVLNWERYNDSEKSFAEAASEIVEFTQFDIRNRILRRLPLYLPLRSFARVALLDPRIVSPNALLESYYTKHLYGARCLYEIRTAPSLHILATSISTGALSVFNQNGLYIQDREKTSFDHVPGRLASVSKVVGASSAFPGFFPPTKFTAADLGLREGQFTTQYFTDGGVYDNLGLRAFSWLASENKEFDRILISDAGRPFQIVTEAATGILGRSIRANDILYDRVGQLEREIFNAQENLVFVSITDKVNLSEDQTAQHPVVQAEVQSIRTDLDSFSPDEINALCRHGYEIARKRCRDSDILGSRSAPDAPPWTPIPTAERGRGGDGRADFQKPSSNTYLSRLLHRSSSRKLLSDFLDWRDWPSYVYLTIALLLFVFIPSEIYTLYRTSQNQSAIIESIASGNPDIRHILELANSNPLVEWAADEAQEKATLSPTDYDGVEILYHNRIYDLRRWNPDADAEERRGKVYARDRITLKLDSNYQGDGRITFRSPATDHLGIQFRHGDGSFPGEINQVRVADGSANPENRVYEFTYDLSELPREDPVTIVLEATVANYPKTVRIPVVTYTATDLLSVWILFSKDRPYQDYSLVSYPVDRHDPPQLMQSQYAIDHPFGTFIGWAVVNPQTDWVYETRWTTD